jgi:polysaccharide export outer membrane protein
MCVLAFAAIGCAAFLGAQAPAPGAGQPAQAAPVANPAEAGSHAATSAAHAPAAPAVGVRPPSDYVIGPEDVLGVLFWREPEMSGDLAVRPDGLIALPLIGDITAAGLTPDGLRAALEESASRYITEPHVTIVVKQINSRKVFITGEVTNPGAYALTAPRTVMQLIAIAGGLKEYADAKNITIMRLENGRQRSYRFNYNVVAQGKALAQNILLQPGDTVVVP